MIIAVVAVLIGLGYFFYPARFAWVRISVKYLTGFFCIWAALVFIQPEVPQTVHKTISLCLLCAAGILILADLSAAAYLWFAERIGNFFKKRPQLAGYLTEIWAAFEKLAARKIGALIVLQQKHPLRSLMKGGMPFDAEIKADILIPLFLTTSPVHDGALVVHKGRIQTVKGILPLASLSDIMPNFGTRHRAAIGITEKTDAIALVVSEERGQISIAYRGCLVRIKDQAEFSRVMTWVLKGKNILRLKNVDFVVTSKVLGDLE